MKKFFIIIILFILIIFNLLTTKVFTQTNKINVDGVITQNEYSNKFSFDGGNFLVYTEILGDIVYFAIESTAKGWVSIGFDPTNAMKDADMIFGVVLEKETKAYDTYSTGIFGPHPDDTSLGGTFDILAFSGKRDQNKIYFEFSRKLNTGDKFDKIITKGKDIKLIWAYSNSNDINSKHTKRGSGLINIK
ncbi:MAG: DOMON domain-containing protein [Spirochaetes bacterium]|nr:DOMON domain-containing protein [Spirochaetota bacterium]